MNLPESARALLAGAPLTHVATIGRDGAPHVSGTWVTAETDHLIIATLGENQKIKNLRRDARCTLSFESPEKNEWGVQKYLVVHGTAHITEGGAPDVLRAQAIRYMGPGVKFPPSDNPAPGFVIRIAVERITGVGPWTEGV